MTRQLDRINNGNAHGAAFRRLWQKNCEKIEQLFDDVFTALASMSEVAPITINADYQGNVDPASQLPYQFTVQRFNSTTDVTTGSTWSISIPGGITASIGAATGIVTITAITSSGTITVQSVYNGVALTRLVAVTLSLAGAPSSGSGGGTSASDTTFNQISSASHAAISDTLAITVGSGGTATLSANLTVRMNPKVEGTWPVFGKWQYDNAGTWTDIGTEVESNPDCTVENDGVLYYAPAGTLTVNTSQGGFPASSSQSFRLMARNSSGTNTMTFSGTASAVGS